MQRLLKREVARYKQQHIQTGTALGELDHPSYASEFFRSLNLPNISHQVCSGRSVAVPAGLLLLSCAMCLSAGFGPGEASGGQEATGQLQSKRRGARHTAIAACHYSQQARRSYASSRASISTSNPKGGTKKQPLKLRSVKAAETHTPPCI